MSEFNHRKPRWATSLAAVAMGMSACASGGSKPDIKGCGDGMESTARFGFSIPASNAPALLRGQGWDVVKIVETKDRDNLRAPKDLGYIVFAQVGYGATGLSQAQASQDAPKIASMAATELGMTLSAEAPSGVFEAPEGSLYGTFILHFVPSSPCIARPITSV